MKFLADIGISPKAVAWLRANGHDAVHVAQFDYHRRSDAEILELARREGRIVLAHDLGFGALVLASGLELPTVIIFRLSDMRPASVITHLRLIVARYQARLEAGAILSVTERRIRVRTLPL